MKVYVASSWRNSRYFSVVDTLRCEGHVVYDFRLSEEAFNWSDIDPLWESWTLEEFREALEHPLSKQGFAADFKALERADVVVLVMPCGRSAHLEAGWAVGANKRLAILLSDGEPELMYSMADCLATSVQEVVEWLDSLF